MPRPFRSVVTLLLPSASLLPGCGSGGSDIQTPPSGAASVVVAGPDSALTRGQAVQFTAVARDARGDVLPGQVFTWAAADSGVATVSGTGLVTALAEGQTEITAAADTAHGQVLVVVRDDGSGPPIPGSPALEPIASGLTLPLFLTSPPQDQRLFVVEKGGRIMIIEGGTLRSAPFLDISDRISGRTEQGLLGLAFAPDYASSGRFYVYYTDREGDTRVSAFLVSSDPNHADRSSESLILTQAQPGVSHKGGDLAFGPDGMLYISLGDGGSHDGLDRGRGQSLNDLLGAVLRIDVSSGSGYAIPPDNPFVGTPDARGEIWSYGFRNPWRYSFDPATGDLYIADVGESRWEEIDRARATDGGGRGLDYGWSIMEGDDCETAGCDSTGLTLPVLQYGHDAGCAVVGGYVYRGSAVPALQGQYLFGDYCEGWVRSFPADGDPGQPQDWPALSPGRGLTSFGQDAAGEPYLLDRDGNVFKIVQR